MTRRVRITLLAGAGFLLVQLGWILSIAPHYGIDEFDHALRASSVAQGHWEPGDNLGPKDLARGDLIPVRADVAESVRTACEDRPYTKLYNCQPAQQLGNGEVLIASGASRYNPTFYAVVGSAAAPFHGTANLYALRVVTALLACGLFMATIWLAAGRARTRWPIAVTVLAALPTTLYSAAIATPNGVEMIAGLGLWTALLVLTDRDSAPHGRRSAYLLLGLFAAALTNLHTLGAVWLALIAVTVAVIHGPIHTLKTLFPRSRVERVVAGLTGFAIAFEIVWILMSGNTDTSIERTVIPGSPWPGVFNGLLLWPLQAIGAFPMRDNSAPPAVYAIMLVVLIAIAVLTLRRIRLRSREAMALGFVAVMSFAVPAVMTVLTFHDIGWAWQGRYGMPFTVGLLVLAGRQLDQAARPVAKSQALVVIGGIALVGAQFISQWTVMVKQRSNFELVTGTNWTPPSAALILTLAIVTAVCWISALKLAPHEDSGPGAPLNQPVPTPLEVSA